MSNTRQAIKRHNNPLTWFIAGFMICEIVNALLMSDCPALRWIGPF